MTKVTADSAKDAPPTAAAVVCVVGSRLTELTELTGLTELTKVMELAVAQ